VNAAVCEEESDGDLEELPDSPDDNHILKASLSDNSAIGPQKNHRRNFSR
jgi:hypothetical protein